jgi:hypothetical protein
MVLFNDMRRFEAGKLSGKGEENDVVEAMKNPHIQVMITGIRERKHLLLRENKGEGIFRGEASLSYRMTVEKS